ncbi:MAG: preprotein translocase subunit SecG [Bacteroidales bacterium]|nr:preprotein translocase subunit SecG [Bacteroidales bacterium]
MNALFTVLTVLIILASIFLTLAVLLQNGKGGGIASNFTTGNQTFGVRQTADMLEKITWGLVAFIFVCSIVTTWCFKGAGSDEVSVPELQGIEAPATFPGQGQVDEAAATPVETEAAAESNE